MADKSLGERLKKIPYLADDTAKLIEEFLNGKRENTVKGYISVLFLLAKLSGKDVRSAGPADIEKFRKEIDDKSNKTFNNYVAYLVSLFKFFDEKTGSDMSELVRRIPRKMINYELSARSVPTKSDVDKVLMKLLDDGNVLEFVPLYMVLRCALSTGDIAALTNNMIKYNGQAYYVHFRATGQLKARDVLLPADVTDALSEYIRSYRPDYASDPHGVFFVNHRHDPLTDRTLQLMLKRACESAEVKPFTLNDMRNLGIPLLISSGKSWDEVAAITGTGTEWYMVRYNSIAKRCGDEKKDIKEEIRAFLPSYEAGQMDAEKIAGYVGALPWEVEKMIKEIRDEQ